MLKRCSLRLSISCILISLLSTGCFFRSKEEKTAQRATEAFRQEPAKKEVVKKEPTKVASKTSGNPKWKKDIDKTLTKARTTVPNNTAAVNKSKPPGRNPNTSVAVDLEPREGDHLPQR